MRQTTVSSGSVVVGWAVMALLGVLASGCVSAKVDFEDVEVTKQKLSFPGIPATMPIDAIDDIPESAWEELGFLRAGEDYALPAQRFSYADAANRLPDGFTASLEVKDVAVRAHRHGQKLSFLRGLRLTVADPSVKKGHPRTVFEYSAADRSGRKNDGFIHGSVAGTEASIDPSNFGSQSYELTVWCDLAELPHEPWAVDVTLTLSGSVEMDY